MRCVVLLLGGICATAQTKFDYYPEIRALLREAEAAAAGTVRLENRRDPFAWIGSLYERGGYLDDARRVFLKSPGAAVHLRARVLYGDLPNALAEAESKKDPVERAAWFESIADTLWRIGQPELARTALDKADAAAKTIPDPKKRDIRLQITAQLRGALHDAPPSPLTTEPQPRPKRIVAAADQIPLFPVTADGFRKRTGAEVAADAQTNAAFLTQLYSLVAIGNRNGIEQVIDSAGTAHRKILALASLEHLALLQRQPEFAEECAARMPVGDGNLLLLKAEAFSAAGAGWGRAKDFDRASRAFEEALRFVDLAGREWAYGKAIVTAANRRGASRSRPDRHKPRDLRSGLAPNQRSASTSRAERPRLFGLILSGQVSSGRVRGNIRGRTAGSRSKRRQADLDSLDRRKSERRRFGDSRLARRWP